MLNKILTPKPNSLLPLVLDNIGFERNGRQLLHNISCRIAGEPITVIMGPNGAGKSLLLKIMHGLLPPSRGSIRGGKDGTIDFAYGHNLPTAISLQNPILLRRSVGDNLKAALCAACVREPQRSYFAETLLQWAGLVALRDRSARLLSGGEKQALCLARALVSQPQLLLLDEPCANLDPQATDKVEILMRDAAAHNIKICLITHDIAQAKRLAGEVIFIHQGRLCEISAAGQFFKKPQSREARYYVAGKLLIYS